MNFSVHPPKQPQIDTTRPDAKELILVAVIVGIAGFLNFYHIDHSGYGNTYYAATVSSDLQSLHNLFFVSFDPGGFVSVDKPPLGFWIMALSAKILGFNGFSLILPNALAGCCSVAMLYWLVRRSFGVASGAIAAFALAITPISVVVNRDTILDGMLVAIILLATWAIVHAIDSRDIRWLYIGAGLVGIGFNMKSLEAYLFVPALTAIFLFASHYSWRKRLFHLLGSGALMLVVSMAWITIVDAVPASQRPYVGSTYTNSELELALGYNGTQRLLGAHYSPTPTIAVPTSIPQSSQTTIQPDSHIAMNSVDALSSALARATAAQARQIGTSPTGAPVTSLGTPGIARLLLDRPNAQTSWWLELALFGLGSGVWRFRKSTIQLMGKGQPLKPEQQAFILWGVWLFTGLIFFSFARFFNAYYFVTLSPAIAAICGISTVGYYKDIRKGNWRGALLPIAIALTGWQQYTNIIDYQTWLPWLHPIVLGGSLAAAAGLAIVISWRLRLIEKNDIHQAGLALKSTQYLISFALALTLMVPLFWTISSLRSDNSGDFPYAGPAPNPLSGNIQQHVDASLITYVVHHRGNAAFLIATVNVPTAVPFVLATNAPVMAMGGYTGYDPILTQDILTQKIRQAQIRYFYIPMQNLTRIQLETLYPISSIPLSYQTHFTNQLTFWISQHCQPLMPSLWSSSYNAANTLQPMQLFDCRQSNI